MEIRKTVKIEPLTTDGKPLAQGLKYLFSDGERMFCGVYGGTSKKGALIFTGVTVGAFKDIRFNVMPRTIRTIYEASIDVLADAEGKNEED